MATQFSSPTITTSSMASSFDSLSSIHSFSDDNDYIVWDISDSMTESSSELTESSISLSLAFDDDFIVLTRRSPSDIVLSPAVPQEATEDYRSSYQSVVAELSTIDFNIPPPSLPPRSPKAARKAKVATPKPKRPKKEKAKATKTATAANAQASTRPSKKHPTTTVTPSSAAPSKPPAQPRKAKKSKSKIKKKAATQAPPSKPVAKTGLGTRPIVDDVSSDAGRDSNPDLQSWHYDDAKQYISCFLSNPARDTTNHLTLLQSLIIELGLCNAPPRPKNKTQSTVLPRTLTAAKAFVKSHVFVNIRDYLAVREQGQAAVQAVMHPSKTALIKDIRKNGNRASLKWVKKHGLQVLLVTCYY